MCPAIAESSSTARRCDGIHVQSKAPAPLRIVLVDDHDVVRRGARCVLSDGFPGALFGEAADAREGLARIASGAWDLVVLDINMPGRNGLDLLQDVKRRWPRLPVLILSGYAEAEFALRCLRLGASGYLTKRGAARELVPAARKAVSGGKYVTAWLAERLASALAEDVPPAPHEALSARELQVLVLVASGLRQRQIAAELSLSAKTIGTYRARIAEKLGVSSSVGLARYAVLNGLADWAQTGPPRVGHFSDGRFGLLPAASRRRSSLPCRADRRGGRRGNTKLARR